MKREVKLSTVKRGQLVEYLFKSLYGNRTQLVRGIVVSKKNGTVELLDIDTKCTWLVSPDNTVSVDFQIQIDFQFQIDFQLKKFKKKFLKDQDPILKMLIFKK